MRSICFRFTAANPPGALRMQTSASHFHASIVAITLLYVGAGVVTRLGTGVPWNRGSIHGTARYILLRFFKLSRPTLRFTKLPVQFFVIFFSEKESCAIILTSDSVQHWS
jgi:hypothetical protein